MATIKANGAAASVWERAGHYSGRSLTPDRRTARRWPALASEIGAISGRSAGVVISPASRPKPAVLITHLKTAPEIGGIAGLGSTSSGCPTTTTF